MLFPELDKHTNSEGRPLFPKGGAPFPIAYTKFRVYGTKRFIYAGLIRPAPGSAYRLTLYAEDDARIEVKRLVNASQCIAMPYSNFRTFFNGVVEFLYWTDDVRNLDNVPLVSYKNIAMDPVTKQRMVKDELDF